VRPNEVDERLNLDALERSVRAHAANCSAILCR
jgi:hypothetical protein